ncbi:neuraminidase-like domain-containing protein [Xenorhabdus bharatensis]|uniref:Tc toxin subunit A-related protein n=1 Tax=Xenorhabdus bharatensis TaxID=3136256 RepID=UPI0030F46336
MNKFHAQIPEALRNKCGFYCSSDICQRSFEQFRQEVREHLSWSETRALYDNALEDQKSHRLYEAKLLSRTNPQLQNAIHLAMNNSDAAQYSYKNEFGDRANQFVAPDSVASMFSPAAYLTELYREARNLHTEDSLYHLDKRRPDLSTLALSQQNMDKEISTLSLSNELLLEGIKKKRGLKDQSAVMKHLSIIGATDFTPYHDAYETVRQAINLHDPGLKQLTASPAVAKLIPPASLLAMQNTISPVAFENLKKELPENVTEENAEELYKRYFGYVLPEMAVTPNHLKSLPFEFSNEEIEQFKEIELVTRVNKEVEQKKQYIDNKLTISLKEENGFNARYEITRTHIDPKEVLPEEAIRDLDLSHDRQENIIGLFPKGRGFYKLVYPKNNPETYYQSDIFITRFKDGKETAERIHISNLDQFEDTDGNLITVINLNQEIREKHDDSFSLNPLKIILIKFDASRTSKAKVVASSEFKIERTDLYSMINKDQLSLVKLFNKIRLSRLIKIPLSLKDISDNQEIEKRVMDTFFRPYTYMHRYGIDAEKATVLCNGVISAKANKNKFSQFDHLFNTPLLDNDTFSADNKEIDFTSNHTPERYKTILKRAFNVDDIAFYHLLDVAIGHKGKFFVNNQENLSALYRAKLLAETHQLSLIELKLLLTALGKNNAFLSGMNNNDLAELIDNIYTVTQWLQAKKWDVYQLFLMTTDTYDKTLTPEIQSLHNTVSHGLQSLDNAKNQATKSVLLEKMAHFIAASLQLPSENVAHSILLWADKLKPGNGQMTAEKFWSWLSTEYHSENKNSVVTQEHAVQYCHCLAQLAMIYRALDLGETAFQLFVKSPEYFGISSDITRTPFSLITLTRFSDWFHSLGEQASVILTEFTKQTLTAEQLAHAMNLDIELLKKANIQAFSSVNTKELKHPKHLEDLRRDLEYIMLGLKDLNNPEIPKNYLEDLKKGHLKNILKNVLKNPQKMLDDLNKLNSLESLKEFIKNFLEELDGKEQEIILTNWPSIDATLQWVNLSQTFNTPPQHLALLVELNRNPEYANWQTAATLLSAGLDNQKTNILNDYLDKVRSTALSQYYIREVSDSTLHINTREDLYQHLLIDNQVSASIKTTRIAEAISSVQLYINRALQKMELDKFQANVTTRQFFMDWDKYNKRYSTWSGVSQLVYYPENYIDPTMRIGQTHMMDNLLQSISQSQLNTDTVEDAFKTYLTEFEKIANLEIISAYHDHIHNHEGLTYFIGQSKTEVGEYYWRSVDHSKFSEGKFAANAWSEWHKIDCPINPHRALLHPVIYKSRLYLVWLEQKEQAQQNELKNAATQTESKNTGTKTESKSVAKHYYYELKLAYIRYDGTWNAPLVFTLPKEAVNLLTQNNDSISLYCVHCPDNNTLLAMLHKTEKETKDYKNNSKEVHGLCISADMSAEKMKDWSLYHTSGYTHFDTTDVKRVNIPCTESQYTLSRTSIGHSNSNSWGKYGLTQLSGGSISNISLTGSKMSLSPKICIAYRGKTTSLKKQCDLMIKHGKVGDKFTIYTNINQGTPHIYPVYQHNGNNANRLLFSIAGNKKSGEHYASVYLHGGSKKDSGKFSVHEGFIDNKNDSGDIFNKDFSIMLTQQQRTYYSNVDSHELQAFPFPSDSYWPQSWERRRDPFDWPWSDFRERDRITYSRTSVKGPVTIDTGIDVDTVKVTIKSGGNNIDFIDKNSIKDHKSGNLQNIVYSSSPIKIDVSKLKFTGNKANIEITFSAVAKDNRNLGSETFNMTVYQKIESEDNAPILLRHNSNGVQYMEWDKKPIRLNTLFAHQLIKLAGNGIDTILNIETQKIHEPGIADSAETEMDFSGANALYFWELFYYTPMMVAQRLLQEQNFDEANRWLKYVFSPSGYTVQGHHKDYHWNVRPLLEQTSWNSHPLDSVDPDAVAQHDPTHYKVATFMRTLDLLLARGDHAYRQLERDTLNEAKMWYMQALHLLGDMPPLPMDSIWSEPTLESAASQTTQRAHTLALAAAQHKEIPPAEVSEPLYTANSLTKLFLPQINGVMLDYWKKLKQRLYNLRHNLSIDGQPLYLPIYAKSADPKALLSAAVSSSQGGNEMPKAFMPLWRFPHMLENARGMVSHLIQFGSTLQSIIERQDAEALNALLHNQAKELMLTTLKIQDKAIEELAKEKTVLEQSKAGAQTRYDHYHGLYEEDVNAGEKSAMEMRATSQGISLGTKGLYMAGAALEMVPNIYGMAVGGSRYGAITNAIAIGSEVIAGSLQIAADTVAQSEAWRRRRQEWEIQYKNADAELKQIDAQLAALLVRTESAELQKQNLITQQEQAEAQLSFMQTKFSNQALYHWLRGRLAAIYFQFYDLTVSRCLMAEQAYRWETNKLEASFIKPGAWQGTYAGLLAGETLMLNLAQMEDSHLRYEQRALEVERTVSMANVYNNLSENNKFNLSDKVSELLRDGKGNYGQNGNTLKLENANSLTSLQASISLVDLKISDDYPQFKDRTRRIKQISVTLPALLGPYQDIQAILSYGGSHSNLAKGCESLAISRGLNDSGQFQLDFNDGKFLPFEGIPVDDKGTLTLSFPNALSKQETILQSLNDIILHIRYTINQ